MKQDNIGKIYIHEKKSLISIVYTNLQFCQFIISEKCFLHHVSNRNDGKAYIVGFLTVCVLAPVLLSPALVKHTRVGGIWVNAV